MGAQSESSLESETRAEKKSRRWKAPLIGLVAVVAVLVGASAAGVGDVIDLPEWANVQGVDVPLIGDTDNLNCRLSQVEGTTDVEIRIMDGDESTYDDFQYVFNNGELRDAEELTRVSSDVIISPSRPNAVTQFYAIATEPLPEARLFCSSIDLE